MKKKNVLLTLSSMAFIALLLFFPSVSIKGSKAGLLLWFQVLLPTLLPYLMISSLLRVLLPQKKSTAFFIGLGLFSGYPVGAKMVGDEYRMGNLSYRNSIFFLSFCNQASAMFILVYVGMHSLQLGSFRYVFFINILVSTLLGSFIGSRFIKEQKNMYPSPSENIPSENLSLSKQLDQIVLDSFVTITKIGGYVILFSILAQFVTVILRGNAYITVLCSGLLEITTGANSLVSASIPATNKIVLASALITFGGCSALAQTKSVISETGLSINNYIFCKICSALFATLFSILFFCFF